MARADEIQTRVYEILKSALPDFDCTWGFVKRNPKNLWCYMGDLAWPDSEWATNRSRQHTITIPIVLNTIRPRTDAQRETRYLLDCLAELEAAFDADSTLRDTGVITWGLAPRMVGTQPHTDGIEAQGAFELRVTYRP